LIEIRNDGAGVDIRQHYDGLNRIVARDENGNITTNVWDNWDLLEEHSSNDSFQRMYLHGGATNEIAVSWGPAYGDTYYFQDGRGNTTHLTDDSNNVIEHYTYYVSGQPSYFDGNNNSMSGSLVSNRFLFGGAQLVPQTEIYDMRNRFYLPNLGRFLQPDPLGFGGGDANLFRFCGGDPVNRRDPFGLKPDPQKRKDSNDLGFSHDPNAPFSTQGWWSNPDGTPTAIAGVGSATDGNQGGGGGGGGGGARPQGSGSAGNTGSFSTGYTDVYNYDKDSYELINITVIGWWGSSTSSIFGAAQFVFLPVTRNEPSSMLARATNWLAANHPELNPRQHPAVLGPVKGGDATYNWYPWSRQIIIDPAKNLTDGEYVFAYTHELLHAQDSLWRNAAKTPCGETR